MHTCMCIDLCVGIYTHTHTQMHIHIHVCIYDLTFHNCRSWLSNIYRAAVFASDSGAWGPAGRPLGREDEGQVGRAQSSWNYEHQLGPTGRMEWQPVPILVVSAVGRVAWVSAFGHRPSTPPTQKSEGWRRIQRKQAQPPGLLTPEGEPADNLGCTLVAASLPPSGLWMPYQCAYLF